ncbi:MAG: hypothetical protein DIAAKJNI_00575 [Candidatus Argoarchaeum ethanivorans]|uniref:Uncharacterized protein n=1 Tax=Candidatus Argoarchaeum ethanivorans TaxID=2608793 RepID=A0A811TGM9_9EURY|nr:MAG: hypothetical protein DIAAKJNI_00575 [Candidatus Argoarchaeum ethanivorans]
MSLAESTLRVEKLILDITLPHTSYMILLRKFWDNTYGRPVHRKLLTGQGLTSRTTNASRLRN